MDIFVPSQEDTDEGAEKDMHMGKIGNDLRDPWFYTREGMDWLEEMDQD